MILKKKNVFKKHDFKEKIIFKKQILKKPLHTKNRFWFSLPRKMGKVCALRAILKSAILKKKFFLKSMILNVNFFLKSMILNEKVLSKAWYWIKNFSLCQILNQNIFVLSDCESTFLQRVRFWRKIFTTCQILNQLLNTRQISKWIFYNVWDFECTSFEEVCQIFMCSLKQGMFRLCLNVWYGFC